MDTGQLDALPRSDAADALASCCGSSRWVSRMLIRRPFGSLERVLAEAEEAWRSLTPSDWLEAFAHHPRIGEQQSETPQGRQAATWSAGEQSRVTEAAGSVRQALIEMNRAYEARFGYIYIVCASGRSAEELLALARARLSHEPKAELLIAAEEQLKITLLRLRKLLRRSPEP